MVPPTAKHARIFILDDTTLDAHSVLKESVLLFLVLFVLLNELLDPPYRKDESNPPNDDDKNSYPILVHTSWLSFQEDTSSHGLLHFLFSSIEIDAGCEIFHKALSKL
jgi:hypothetical protein